MSTTSRGYGSSHQRSRQGWARAVATGTVPCFRCGKPIAADAEWDLDHRDDDRTAPAAPSHRACNRRAGAAKTNGMMRDPEPHSRVW